MNNRQLAETFTQIADLLEIKGEVIYKTMAYRRAAESLAGLSRDVNDMWKEGKLREIPGVGEAIATKIDELLRTGKLDMLERVRTQSVEWKVVDRERGLVIIKPSGGGGGIGMSIVADESGLKNALQSAQALAVTTFGLGEVFIEKCQFRIRYLEIARFITP